MPLSSTAMPAFAAPRSRRAAFLAARYASRLGFFFSFLLAFTNASLFSNVRRARPLFATTWEMELSRLDELYFKPRPFRDVCPGRRPDFSTRCGFRLDVFFFVWMDDGMMDVQETRFKLNVLFGFGFDRGLLKKCR